MRRVWSFVFYGLCVFAVAFSLFWIALPRFEPPAPSADETQPSSALGLYAQGQPEREAEYYLCDKGGRLAVYACGEGGEPEKLIEYTSIYVNLLPEGDALRIKRGVTVYSEKELYMLLEDLGR